MLVETNCLEKDHLTNQREDMPALIGRPSSTEAPCSAH